MRIQSLANAGLLIEADGVRLLCDPWFTDGAYQGAWAIWPQPLTNPVMDIGKVDAIYISHIHPDHYDQTFLRQYLQQWGYTPILCGLLSLCEALRADGFPSAVVAPNGNIKNYVHYRIVPNTSRLEPSEVTIEGREPIDTALALRCGGDSLINMNDNPFHSEQVRALLSFCGGPPTVAYLPFAGASSFPQRFPHAPSGEADKKKRICLERFRTYADTLQPHYAVPFAGEYWLQGPLAQYNHLRGQADATEAVDLAKQAVLPAAGAWFDTATGQASAVRTVPYDAQQAQDEIAARGFTGYAYERDYPEWPYVACDLARLKQEARWAAETRLGRTLEMPSVEMDQRYFAGLLTGRYHWNDALISSHVQYHLPPNAEPSVYEALEEWHL